MGGVFAWLGCIVIVNVPTTRVEVSDVIVTLPAPPGSAVNHYCPPDVMFALLGFPKFSE
jgi:hypothetical protein